MTPSGAPTRTSPTSPTSGAPPREPHGPDPLRIAVIGSGYVGLVAAACFSEIGHRVVGGDADEQKVRSLQRGVLPIYEPGLQAIVSTNQAAGRLSFTRDLDDALHLAELVIIAVGTPAGIGGATDLEAVLAAATRIAAQLPAPATVVIKSTVPVGTTERIQQLIAAQLRARGVEWRVPVLGNPEFLREGCAIRDFMSPDRIVVGAHTDDDAADLVRAYAPLTARGARLLRMAPRSAELTKYASNAMLAVRVSFMNEIAAIAEATQADIEEVREGVGSDSRIGPAFLRAGIGYGGSCFPKDVASLSHTAVAHGVRPQLIRATEQVNRRQKRWAFDRLQRFYATRRGLRGRRIALWGLAFKPGTDDLREAPSLALIAQLRAAGAEVVAYDPVALQAARQLLRDVPVVWCDSAADALEEADALVLVTEWDEFRQFPVAALASALRDKLVVDGRNVLDAPACALAGLTLMQVGRPRLPPAVRAAVAAPATRTGASARIAA